ncbi:hypothetical protein PIB30_057792 [Stylosanthes scabra]|uniref:Glabrous enhancer-binding protein-like DBD domain-containing protein n=1 Tax=Stylosanthes scabra TaxID=79078 RepID=A0ABU6ULU0_9FABA|nr:hypothetical protein [Stylosanthes scabra]
MFSPFVSWLMSSTSSSSSSISDEQEQEQGTDIDDNSTDQPYPQNDTLNDQNDNNNDQPNDDENDEHFLSSCAGGDDAIPIALAVPSTATATTGPSPIPAVTVAFTAADVRIPVATATTVVTQPKRRRAVNYAGMMKQYQRLWTKQDEIELLRGYLEHVRRNKGARKSLQNDVALFYGGVCHKLNMDFNKNQLVEKLRRLKRKHKVTLDKGNLGKISFRNPQDESIFNISHKIWGNDIDAEQLDEEEEAALDLDGGGVDDDHGKEKVKIEEVVICDEIEESNPKRLRLIENEAETAAELQIQSFIEETMRSCFPPLMKELLEDEGGVKKPVELCPGVGDERGEEWRKQMISELQVYLNRLELLQDQIKAKLEELRSDKKSNFMKIDASYSFLIGFAFNPSLHSHSSTGRLRSPWRASSSPSHKSRPLPTSTRLNDHATSTVLADSNAAQPPRGAATIVLAVTPFAVCSP